MEKDSVKGLNIGEGPSNEEMTALRDKIQQHAKDLNEQNEKYKK